MTDQERKVWLKALLEDLAHLSDAELAYGCARYRRDPANRFFPSPGQLREACKNQFDSPPGKTYAPLPELPPPMEAEEAERIISETYRKLRYFPHITSGGEPSTAVLKEEILARPPIAAVPMTAHRREELLTSVKRALEFKYGPEQAAKYIAELPT